MEEKKEEEGATAYAQNGWVRPNDVGPDSFICDSGITPPAHRILKKRWKRFRNQKVRERGEEGGRKGKEGGEGFCFFVRKIIFIYFSFFPLLFSPQIPPESVSQTEEKIFSIKCGHEEIVEVEILSETDDEDDGGSKVRKDKRKRERT